MRARRSVMAAVVALGCLLAGLNILPAPAAGMPADGLAGRRAVDLSEVDLSKAASIGWVYIMNNKSGLVASVNYRTDDGAPVLQDYLRVTSTHEIAPEQAWMLTEVRPGWYSIRNANTSSWKALSITAGHHANGTRAIQWGYNGGKDQIFKLDYTSWGYRFINDESKKCLGVNGASERPGAALLQWDCLNSYDASLAPEMLWSFRAPPSMN
jgi:hypothetical protein